VLSDNAGALSNWELSLVLRRRRQERAELEAKIPLPGARRSASSSAVTWLAQQEISDQVLAYLEQTDCVSQSREAIKKFCGAVRKFKLTQAEVMQLVNSAPRSRVEVYLIIEECEERLTPAQVQELLALCKANLCMDEGESSP
ncbi:MAG: hypothetical protein SGPRY_007301, partial [Prymnesium sp.]